MPENNFDIIPAPSPTDEDLNKSTPNLLAISPNIDSLFTQAQQLYLQAKHKLALTILFDIIKINPNIAKVYDLTACVKWRQGQFIEQVEFANRAIELDSQMRDAYNLAAIGYSHLGNDAETIKNYNICISNEPENYAFIRNRGLSYLDLEDSPKTQNCDR